MIHHEYSLDRRSGQRILNEMLVVYRVLSARLVISRRVAKKPVPEFVLDNMKGAVAPGIVVDENVGVEWLLNLVNRIVGFPPKALPCPDVFWIKRATVHNEGSGLARNIKFGYVARKEEIQPFWSIHAARNPSCGVKLGVNEVVSAFTESPPASSGTVRDTTFKQIRVLIENDLWWRRGTVVNGQTYAQRLTIEVARRSQ